MNGMLIGKVYGELIKAQLAWVERLYGRWTFLIWFCCGFASAALMVVLTPGGRDVPAIFGIAAFGTLFAMLGPAGLLLLGCVWVIYYLTL